MDTICYYYSIVYIYIFIFCPFLHQRCCSISVRVSVFHFLYAILIVSTFSFDLCYSCCWQLKVRNFIYISNIHITYANFPRKRNQSLFCWPGPLTTRANTTYINPTIFNFTICEKLLVIRGDEILV